jgi:hypothetical protein
MRGAYVLFVGKREKKRKLAMPRWRWQDNVKINLQET